MKDWRKSYCNQFSIYATYWSAYGGWPAFFLSAYFHFAIVVTAICYPIWTSPEWWNLSLELLPSLLGFSLGAFAMLLAFGNEAFQRVLATIPKEGKHSAYEQIAASFCHFILVQFFAILCALIFKAHYEPLPPNFHYVASDAELALLALRTIGWCFGFFLLAYSGATGVAATMRIFRLTLMFTKVQMSDKNSDKP